MSGTGSHDRARRRGRASATAQVHRARQRAPPGSTASYPRADLIHGDLTSMLDNESSRAETGLSAPIARSRSEARSPGTGGTGSRFRRAFPATIRSVHCCDVDWNSHRRGGANASRRSHLTGSAAGCTPTAHPAGTRSIPPATTPGSKSRAWSEPPLNRAASLLWTTQIRQVSGRFRNRGASTTTSLSLYLSVSLARTRASGSAARSSHCRERLTSSARSRASAVPSFSEPLHQPGAGIPAGTDEMLMSVISFRMAPRGAGSSSSASRTRAGRPGRDGSS